MTSQPQTKRTILYISIAAAILVIALIILAVTQGLKRPQSSTQDGAIEFAQSDGNLTPGEDAELNMDNVTVYIPADAIESAGSILITSRSLNLLPVSEDTEWSRIQAVNVEYRDADGTLHTYAVFPAPLEICFQVPESLWSTYEELPDNYQVQTYSDEQKTWDSLPMVTHAEHLQLCGQTTHLSLFALAVKQEVVVPITGATQGPYDQP